MGGREDFKKTAKILAERFRESDKNVVKIVSNLDTDGITAAAILVAAFRREGIKFSLSLVKQLSRNVLSVLSKEPYEIIVFADLGSSVVTNIKKYLPGRKIFILDHHIVECEDKEIYQLNQHLFGLNEYNEISASGVCYFFAKELNKKNIELAHIAFIGAVGDVQEYKGVRGLNKEILDDAVSLGKIEIKTGLRMFGYQTKPVHKVLEYCTDPYIPGVSGDESGAVMFLEDCGIQAKNGEEWRKLVDLNDDEVKKLITGIILRRIGSEDKPEDVLGPIYTLKDEEEGSTKDVKEYATLLNSCARLGKSAIGIGTVLGNKNAKEKALVLIEEYKKMIINGLNWFYDNRKSENIFEGDGFVIINAGENIKDTIIGVIGSIISRAGIYNEGTIIISIAKNLEGDLKSSIRVAGLKVNEELNLRDVLTDVVKGLDAEVGGHKLAAGSLVSINKEREFIDNIKVVLGNRKV